MAEINTVIKGKYAGTCPDCNIMRGDWESKGCMCARCGHVYTTTAIALTLEGKPVEPTDKIVKILS